MKNKMLLKFVVWAVVSSTTIADLSAQTGPGARNAQAPGAAGQGVRRGGRGQLVTEPAAPVPPEVVSPRPSQAEVDKIQAALREFISSSPDKDLLAKYQSLISFQVPRPMSENPCIRPAGSPQNPRHVAFMNIATNEDFDILFLGDSITDLLNVNDDGNGNPGGKPAVEKNFANVKIANFGISGDTTQGVLWRLRNGEGKGHKPKAVMLMIGTNNTGGSSGEEIAEGIGAIVLELRNDFPDARIMLMAIFPRGTGRSDNNRRKCETANKIISRLNDDKHVFFTDINSKFLDEGGGLIGFRSTDHLHPVTEGFEIWMSSVAPTLKGWIK